MRHAFATLFLLLLSLFIPKSVSAVSITLSNFPTSVDINQEFSVDVELICTGCGVSYLRGVFFYPDSSSTYTGFTQNNAGDWINFSSSQATSYYKIDSGSWTGQLKFKFDSTKPAGEYFFKVGRYTANNGSLTSSSMISLIISSTMPPPTESLSVAPSPTATPSLVSTKSSYKLNKPKDETNQILTGVKIYIDNLYTHHQDEEILYFCTDCFCDNERTVACGFGEHTIKLVKSGFSDWSEQRNFSAGSTHEITPILIRLPPESAPSPTVISTPTPTTNLITITTTPRPPLATQGPSSAPSSRLSSESAVLSASDSAEIIPASDNFESVSTPSVDNLPLAKQKAPLRNPPLILIGAGFSIFSLGFLLLRLNILKVKG